MPERHKTLVRLVDLMADGAWHSGQALGDQVGVSRAAVWKHLTKLKELGLPLESVTGRGYRVANPSLALNANRIAASLDADTRRHTKVHVFPVLASSNDWLLARPWPAVGELDVCAADCQTAGRGRRGRQWHTPFGSSIALSVARRFDAGIGAMGPLSLVVGLIVARCLEQLGVDGLGVKWPNDIHHQGSKLAGVLVDLNGEISGPLRAVIGIGINVALPESVTVDQPWTDLITLLDGVSPDRNDLVAEVVNQLDEGLTCFDRQGFAAFKEDWSKVDLLRGRQVTVYQGSDSYPGRANGVTNQGCLRVFTSEGERHISAGEVSVRSTEL